MPKHKIFIDDYGRSSKYRMRKNTLDVLRDIVIPIDENLHETTLSHDESSSSETCIQVVDVNKTGNVDGAINELVRNEFNASHDDADSLNREDLRVDNDTDFELEDFNSEDDECPIDDTKPLYPGAPITFSESMLSILTFALTYNITGTALSDLLTLISLHCLQPCLLKTSLYLFRKYFGNMRYPLNKHYYCSVCFSSLETNDSLCETCETNNGTSYFIEIPILDQLRVLYDRPGFYQSLKHRFYREKQNETNREDIYDGDVYRELCQNNGFLANPDNISFMWNTDGVPIFKSSGFQIWPFYLSINELPYLERSKPQNILLAGLWFGPNKPVPHLFTQPIKTALNGLYKGVYLNVPEKEAPLKVRGMVICGTCDLPAKALFLNMTQFNGKYGCPKCKLRGRSEDGVWIYPFERNLSQRTDEETRDFAEKALNTNAPVYGIKGPSGLSLFVRKLIESTAVDSMHCAFSGNAKKLGSILFDASYSNHPASLSKSIDLTDKRLQNLSPPSNIQRRPRSIKFHFKYWKANELKAWTFYYSLPILHDVMLPEYFEHYSLFVTGIYLLHQSSISPELLERASQLLTEFVNRFDVLYSERHMSCNLHQLMHLKEVARDFGPLFVTSCFSFEDLNGKLKRLVHSSRHPELQICSAVSSLLNLSALQHEKLTPGRAAHEYCSVLSSAKRKMKLGNISEGIKSVGRCLETITLPRTVAEVFAEASINGRKFKTFSRILKDGFLYTSTSYLRAAKYNNTCVRYKERNCTCIGIVESFINVYNCECCFENACECYSPTYAIIRKCRLSTILSEQVQRGIPEFIFECTSVSNRAVPINVQELLCVCFLMEIKDTNRKYIVIPANMIEAE